MIDENKTKPTPGANHLTGTIKWPDPNREGIIEPDAVSLNESVLEDYIGIEPRLADGVRVAFDLIAGDHPPETRTIINLRVLHEEKSTG